MSDQSDSDKLRMRLNPPTGVGNRTSDAALSSSWPRPTSPPLGSPTRIKRFLRLLYHIFAVVSTAAFVVGIAVLFAPTWHQHLLNLLRRSWARFLVYQGTTSPGFLNPIVVAIVIVAGTILAIGYLQGKAAMLKHWWENAAITVLVTATALLVTYGAQYAWKVVQETYDDHNRLAQALANRPSAVVLPQPTNQADESRRVADIKDHLARFMIAYDHLSDCQQQFWHPSDSKLPPDEIAECGKRKAVLDRATEEYLSRNMDSYYLTIFKRDAAGFAEEGTLREWVDGPNLKPASVPSESDMRKAAREQLGRFITEYDELRQHACAGPGAPCDEARRKLQARVEKYLRTGPSLDSSYLARFNAQKGVSSLPFQDIPQDIGILRSFIEELR